ncbi:hypothetical protein SAMN05443287_101537 [Micromonospora phaseoli]|uniref:Uncharacterized protein n=1 Tax=Micromonospora phaseoli TaxID=1144548 RepID=A0A1H6SCK4_9ACTN|nr:hypothetical protein CLV64_101537 [Micromonospora phaseoli]GIJ79083.1 hypothetical protein Xph01_35150 [Micromonospora phaseoli]SEI62477.1 hypothetical protein SAMN05443287_101537 [Micromonospora phaseoli]
MPTPGRSWRTNASPSQRLARITPGAGLLGGGIAAWLGSETGNPLLGLVVAALLALPALLISTLVAVVILRRHESVDDRIKLIKALAEFLKSR